MVCGGNEHEGASSSSIEDNCWKRFQAWQLARRRDRVPPTGPSIDEARAFLRHLVSFKGRAHSVLSADGNASRLVSLIAPNTHDVLQGQALEVICSLACEERCGVLLRECGVIPALCLYLIPYMNPIRQTNAVAALGNLAINEENKDLIRQAGVVPFLVGLLHNPVESLRAYACGALGNIALRNRTNQDLVRTLGAVPTIVSLLSSSSQTVTAHAVAALWNICARNEANQAIIQQCGGIPPLVALLSNSHDTVRSDACATLGNLAFHNEVSLQLIRQHGGMASLLALLESESEGLQSSLRSTLRNFATAGDISDVLEGLSARLAHPVSAVRANATVTISILASSSVRCREQLQAGCAFRSLVRLAITERDLRCIAEEAIRWLAGDNRSPDSDSDIQMGDDDVAATNGFFGLPTTVGQPAGAWVPAELDLGYLGAGPNYGTYSGIIV